MPESKHDGIKFLSPAFQPAMIDDALLVDSASQIKAGTSPIIVIAAASQVEVSVLLLGIHVSSRCTVAKRTPQR